MDPTASANEMAGGEVWGSDVTKFTVWILILNKFFATVLEPTGYRDWPGAKFDQSAASRNMPGEHAGANVFPLDRAQGIIELPVEIAGEPFIDERVKELTDMPREFPGQGLAQPLFVNRVIDVLGSVAFRVLEVGVNDPIVRKLKSCAGHVADRPDNHIRIPCTHFRQKHAREVGKYRCAGTIKGICPGDFEWRKCVDVTVTESLVRRLSGFFVPLNQELVIQLQVLVYIQSDVYQAAVPRLTWQVHHVVWGKVLVRRDASVGRGKEPVSGCCASQYRVPCAGSVRRRVKSAGGREEERYGRIFGSQHAVVRIGRIGAVRGENRALLIVIERNHDAKL